MNPTQTDIAEATRYFAGRLNDAVLSLREKAMSQFEHNLKHNVPQGILTLEGSPEHAINSGLVRTIAKRFQWDCDATISFAGDLLEDVNCHTEAATVRSWIEEGGQDDQG